MAAHTTVEKASDRQVVLAGLFMGLAAMLAAVDAVIVRMLANEVHPFVIGFFRCLFGLAAILPWIAARRGILASSYRFMHVLRAGLKLLGLVAFFAAFAAAPLADATAIMFMTPIFLTLGAWLVLGEQLGSWRVFGVVMGFIGALIVIQPGHAGAFSPALIFALAGAALMAIVQLMLKSMAAKDSTETLVAWNLILMVPLALVPALFFWTTPSLEALVLLAVQGVLGALNMTLATRAFSLADASFLAPIDFLRLPAVALLAYLLFAEVAGPATWLGAVVIFTATLIASSGGRFSRLGRARLWL